MVDFKYCIGVSKENVLRNGFASNEMRRKGFPEVVWRSFGLFTQERLEYLD